MPIMLKITATYYTRPKTILNNIVSKDASYWNCCLFLCSLLFASAVSKVVNRIHSKNFKFSIFLFSTSFVLWVNFVLARS